MQLRPLLFEQEFHARAGICYTGKLVKKEKKKNQKKPKSIVTQELEIEAHSEEKPNQHQPIAM